MALFSYIFYILKNGVEKFNPKFVYFKRNDSGLNRLYEKMIKNGVLIKHLKDIGYEYNSSEKENYVFRKVN